MKLRHALPLILGLSLITSVAAEKAAPSTGSAPKPGAATNIASAPIIVPASVFNIPSSTTEGRDPFFPNSARLQSGTVKADPNVKSAPIALQLKGISGIGKDRVALINNTTFKVGDTASVTVNGRKIEVTCISIGETSATVEALGARQELQLRQSF